MVSVVGVQVGRRGSRAGTGGLHMPCLRLLLAGGAAEGGRGRPPVVDIALKPGCSVRPLPDDALVVAAGGDGAPGERPRQEFAEPQKAPVVGHRAHLLNGRDAPISSYMGWAPLHRKLGHRIHLRRGEGSGGRVDQQELAAVLFAEWPLPTKGSCSSYSTMLARA